MILFRLLARWVRGWLDQSQTDRETIAEAHRIIASLRERIAQKDAELQVYRGQQ